VYLGDAQARTATDTDDDVVVNKYCTAHWVQPNRDARTRRPGNSFTQNCKPIRDFDRSEHHQPSSNPER
jgi:hypothetical protein